MNGGALPHLPTSLMSAKAMQSIIDTNLLCDPKVYLHP